MPSKFSKVRLTLPAPTGPYPPGTVALHLTDRSRRNPWAASPPHRELMVSIWYPAGDVARYPLSPQMPAGAAARFGSSAGYGRLGYHLPPGKVDWAATVTSGHAGAPLAARIGRLPVVLYSPGGGEPRTWQTILVQDLASRGYIVVTIDHTYEASEVEFPGGRVIGGTIESPFLRDGMSIAPVFARGLDRPFLLMGDPKTNHHSVPSWKSLWDHSRGWHADLTLNGASGENSYKDAVWLIPQIARQIGLPGSFVTRAIGTVDPAGAVHAEQAYLSAFFGRFLRGQHDDLLDSRPPRCSQFAFVE